MDSIVPSSEQPAVNNSSTPTPAPSPSSDVASKNIKFFLLGIGAFLVLVIVASVGVGVYRVYAKAATDPFSGTLAKVFGISVMEVNGHKVPYADYVADMKAIRVMRDYDTQNGGAGAALTDEQMSDQVLWRLANNVLVEEATKASGLTVEEKDIEELKNTIYTQLQNAPDGGAVDLEAAKKRADEELTKRYGWNMEEYTTKVMRPYLLQKKLEEKIKTDEKARAEIRLKAEDVLKKIKGGADFAEMAKQYGQDGTAQNGGDLGYFARGSMVPQFEEAAFKLKKGQLKQDVVETEFGYHIIKVDDRRTVKTKDPATNKTVNTEEVRARHILFLFPSLEEYLDSKAKAAKVALRVKVHDPFQLVDTQPTIITQ